MVNPVSFSPNSNVNFRGDNFEELVNSPGAYARPVGDAQPDEFVSSNGKKKKGFGRKLLGFIGKLAVVAAAAFGLYKWKGASWLNKEATGFGPKLKNILVKPGEWVDKYVVQNCKKLISKIGKKGVEATEEAVKAAEDAVGTI